jgi:hypothetical protein
MENCVEAEPEVRCLGIATSSFEREKVNKVVQFLHRIFIENANQRVATAAHNGEKKETSSIRGGTRSGGQSSWFKTIWTG